MLPVPAVCLHSRCAPELDSQKNRRALASGAHACLAPEKSQNLTEEERPRRTGRVRVRRSDKEACVQGMSVAPGGSLEDNLKGLQDGDTRSIRELMELLAAVSRK